MIKMNKLQATIVFWISCDNVTFLKNVSPVSRCLHSALCVCIFVSNTGGDRARRCQQTLHKTAPCATPQTLPPPSGGEGEDVRKRKLNINSWNPTLWLLTSDGRARKVKTLSVTKYEYKENNYLGMIVHDTIAPSTGDTCQYLDCVSRGVNVIQTASDLDLTRSQTPDW